MELFEFVIFGWYVFLWFVCEGVDWFEVVMGCCGSVIIGWLYDWKYDGVLYEIVWSRMCLIRFVDVFKLDIGVYVRYEGFLDYLGSFIL